MTAGVPQGSVIGYDLWNANYNELLEIPLPKQVQLASLADERQWWIATRRLI